MEIKKYRNFIRERKREVNKLTTGLSTDSIFETKVNSLLEGQISNLEFQTYLENDLYLTINENYMINESLASKFADKVKSKIKSLFNNLYQKLKETSGFRMIISFFEKVVSGISKFWKFLKKIKAGKILKKLSITLGITSLASYILAQFGAGWAALMGGRMAASMIGKKVGDKVVKESYDLMMFEEFVIDNQYRNNHIKKAKEINNFYTKNKELLDSYYDYIFKNIGDINLYNQFKSKLSQLKSHIGKYKTSAFFEFVNWVNNNIKREDKIKSIEFSAKNWRKNSNSEKNSIIDQFENEIGLKLINDLDKVKKDDSDKQNLSKVDVKKGVSKKDKIDEPSNKDSDESGKKSDKESDDKKESKKSIWSKIGGAISTFFKIFRKLKWAIVIFFGVVFILNLIFFPIFEPILQVAQVSSFSMILSDTFEETANAVSSIPKVNLDDLEINTDITDNLPSDSEVTKTIQGAVNDIKGNIEGNEELAAEEADDIVQKSFNETKDPSEIQLNLTEEEEIEKIIKNKEELMKAFRGSGLRSINPDMNVRDFFSNFDISTLDDDDVVKLKYIADTSTDLDTDIYFHNVTFEYPSDTSKLIPDETIDNKLEILKKQIEESGTEEIEPSSTNTVIKDIGDGKYQLIYLIPKK